MIRIIQWLGLIALSLAVTLSSCTKPTQPVLATQSSQATSRQASLLYGGLPKAAGGSEYKLLVNTGYVAGYSESRKDPLWVAYRLFRVSDPQRFPRPSRFQIDTRTDAKVSHNDYTNSGYDRGHMAPNFGIMSRYGREAQLETFLMSNVCPQTPNLNRGEWEELESKEANDYANRFEEIWVITGPIFAKNSKSLQCRVKIPEAFFKIIVDEVNGKPRMIGFIMPQGIKANDLKLFLVSIDEIEKKTGLDFFTEIDDVAEKELEAYRAIDLW